MHSKSKNKLIEEISKLSTEEILRAFTKALMQGNADMIEQIARNLPKEKNQEFNKYFKLLSQKIGLYNQYLMLKAVMAVRYYNVLTFKLFDIGQIEEEPLDFTDDFKKQNELMAQIKKIDELGGSVVEMDEFRTFDELDVICNQWMKVVVKIQSGYTIKTPIEDFEMERKRLEQVFEKMYSESR